MRRDQWRAQPWRAVHLNGHLALAASATALALAVLTLLKYPEQVLKGHIYRVVVIDIRAGHAKAALARARQVLAQPRTKVLDVWSERSVLEDRCVLRVHLRTTQGFDSEDVVEQLSGLDGVERVAWKGPTND